MSEAPLVYVVVLNYRSYSDTIECVRSLQRIDYENFKILVVENGSDNESDEVLRSTFPELEILQTGENLGYSGGNNVGLRRALEDGAEFTLILNPDTLTRVDFLSALITHARSDASAGVLGSLVLNPDGTANPMCARRQPPLGEILWNHGPGRWFGLHEGWRRASFYEGIDNLDAPIEVEVVSGACMLLRSSLIDQIGLLDERSFLFWEEFILAEKMRHSGYKTFLVPASRVVHEGSGSMKTMRVRWALHFLRSLDLYLGSYRKIGRIKRWLVLSGPALFFVPAVLRSLTRMRSRQS